MLRPSLVPGWAHSKGGPLAMDETSLLCQHIMRTTTGRNGSFQNLLSNIWWLSLEGGTKKLSSKTQSHIAFGLNLTFALVSWNWSKQGGFGIRCSLNHSPRKPLCYQVTARHFGFSPQGSVCSESLGPPLSWVSIHISIRIVQESIQYIERASTNQYIICRQCNRKNRQRMGEKTLKPQWNTIRYPSEGRRRKNRQFQLTEKLY